MGEPKDEDPDRPVTREVDVAVPEEIPDDPTHPVATSLERSVAFETARQHSANPDAPDVDGDEAEYRDVHRKRTVRRRVFK
jgi:hypothetical protein